MSDSAGSSPFPPQDQSDIQIECHSVDGLTNQRSCNISAPFMNSLSQVGAAVVKQTTVHLRQTFSSLDFRKNKQMCRTSVITTSAVGSDIVALSVCVMCESSLPFHFPLELSSHS